MTSEATGERQMRVQVTSRAAILILVALASCWNVACADYTIELSDGYRIMRLSGGDRFALLGPDEADSTILVGPSVVAYHDSPRLLVGIVEAPENDPGQGYRPGYFILDKGTKHLSSGLTRSQWEQYMLEHNSGGLPDLRRPHRLQAWF